MTKKDAEAIIRRVCRNELGLHVTKHFWKRVNERLPGFTTQHIYAALRTGEIARSPVLNPSHGNHTVEIRAELIDFGKVLLVASIAEYSGVVCITVYGFS
jgi:hypothetical protein